MKKIFLIISLLVLFHTRLPGMDSEEAKPYYLNTYFGGGGSLFNTDMENTGLIKKGFGGMFRIMWQPEHLLRLGIESGFYHVYDYKGRGTERSEASMNTLPVHLAFMMELFRNFEINFGFGTSLLFITFERGADYSESTQYSSSMSLSASYLLPLSEGFKLGAEGKYYYLGKIKDSNLSLMIVTKIAILKW